MPSTDPDRPDPRGNATASIRAAILDGTYGPGQRLIEADLEDDHGASRGAVRAALLELTRDGLVERVAHRGARVRIVSVEEAVQITEVRMVVESLCAAKAAENADEDDVATLRAIARDMEDAVASGDVMTYSRLNSVLHERVQRIAAQPVATDVLTRLRAQNVRHQFRLALRPGRPRISLPQHLAIVDAVCRRDPDAAAAAMRTHVTSVIDALRETEAGPEGT